VIVGVRLSPNITTILQLLSIQSYSYYQYNLTDTITTILQLLSLQSYTYYQYNLTDTITTILQLQDCSDRSCNIVVIVSVRL
jgi:hypothetical protein